MLDYYKILDISIDADLEKIISSYRCKAKEYHPDKVASLGEDLKLLAAKKMVLINDAYRVLRDPVKRKEYDKGEDESCTKNLAYTINLTRMPAGATLGSTRRGWILGGVRFFKCLILFNCRINFSQ